MLRTEVDNGDFPNKLGYSENWCIKSPLIAEYSIAAGYIGSAMATPANARFIECLRQVVLYGHDSSLSDGDLLSRFIQRSDDSAFAAIVRRHGRMVFNVCHRVLRHEQDAEDAFQATFLVLARKAAGIKPRDMLGNWLYGVAHQTAVRARSADKKRDQRERAISTTESAPLPAEQHDLQRLIDAELSRLPSKYRAALILCDLEGKTRKEAALELDWPEGSVAGRLARGRALLAKRLKQRGVTPSGAVLTSGILIDAATANLPPAIVQKTCQAAIAFAADQTISNIASTKVAALAAEVLKMMLIARLKVLALFVIFATMVAAAGSGLLSIASTAAPINHTQLELGDEQPVKALKPQAGPEARAKEITVDFLFQAQTAALAKIRSLHWKSELWASDLEEGQKVETVAKWEKAVDREVWHSGPKEAEVERVYLIGDQRIPEGRIRISSVNATEYRTLTGWNPLQPFAFPLRIGKGDGNFTRVRGEMGVPRAGRTDFISELYDVSIMVSLKALNEIAEIVPARPSKLGNFAFEVKSLKAEKVKDDYWLGFHFEVDPAHSYLVQQTRRKNGSWTEIKEFAESAEGIWVPKLKFGHGGKSISKMIIESQANQPVSAKNFELSFPEGSQVHDRTKNLFYLWGKESPDKTFENQSDLFKYVRAREKNKS